MRAFLGNPEFVRHLRAEMRAPRMLLSGGLALVITFLISLMHSQATTSLPLSDDRDVVRTLFFWLALVQTIVLTLWTFSAAIHVIASERQMKTYDFVRTTRLTSGDILMGYLFGVPIMAYFTVGVSAVCAILSGLGVGLPLHAMLATYILLFVFSVFISLLGLMISMLLEKPRAVGTLLVIWFLGWPLTAMGAAAIGSSPFPGMASLALVPSLAKMFEPDSRVPFSAPFFGLPVPLFVLTIVLYAAFGGWIVLALLRNLKKEREEIQLLSRTQALLFAAFMNVLFLGLYDRNYHGIFRAGQYDDPQPLITMFIFANQALFYIVGLATLTPAERLKVWYRGFKAGERKYLDESGLPWPWMVIAGAIGFFGCLFMSLMLRNHEIPNTMSPGVIALSIVLVLVFAIRDILFLQWCLLTRMKNPVAKGVGLIWLYYFAATVFSSLFVPNANKATSGLFLLTPAGALIRGTDMNSVIAGLVLQILICGMLLYLINQRLAVMHARTAAVAA